MKEGKGWGIKETEAGVWEEQKVRKKTDEEIKRKDTEIEKKA